METRQKGESVKKGRRSSVFESVFDASYVPFEELFNETYLGAYTVTHPAENKTKGHPHSDEEN